MILFFFYFDGSPDFVIGSLFSFRSGDLHRDV